MNKIIKEFREFNKKQSNHWSCWECEGGLLDDKIEEFILKALAQQKKEIVKVIEGKIWEDDYGDHYWAGYNKALKDILKAIKEL